MTLAIHGGDPVRTRPFPPRPQYGIAERNAANYVVSSGNLSGFLAESGDSFLGGPQVQALEAAFCERFGVAYAVAMNSGTSCLFASLQALVDPRDEVIVPPWSMSASASCVLARGATPVFVDIEPETYGLDPESVERAITARTRAIVVVHLFGRLARMDALTAIAYKHGLKVVEDAAQAVGSADEFGRYAGTIGDVGVFSLNRHKTIQCGEGGVAVTDDAELAERLRGLRNHGEVLSKVTPGWRGVVGQNYRMGEVEAAIAEVQLGRLEELTEPRVRNAEKLTAALAELDELTPPVSGRHAYYLYAVRTPERFIDALRAEGVYVSRYARPLYELPVFRGHAIRDDRRDFNLWYPETERAYREVIVHSLIHAGMTDADLNDVIAAFRKVYEHRGEL